MELAISTTTIPLVDLRCQYETITRIPIDLGHFIRSIFCVSFTRPLFDRTVPNPAWKRHPLEPRAYPSAEQWMSHLRVVAAGDAATLGDLCRHWTHCCIAQWAQRTSAQVQVLQLEVSYLTNGDDILIAEVVQEALVFSDDVGHLLMQAPSKRFLHVYATNADHFFGVAISRIDRHCRRDVHAMHLPNYWIHHNVLGDGGHVTYYKPHSDTFRKRYEDGRITWDPIKGIYRVPGESSTSVTTGATTGAVAVGAVGASDDERRIQLPKEADCPFVGFGAVIPIGDAETRLRAVSNEREKKARRDWTVAVLWGGDWNGWYEGHVANRDRRGMYNVQYINDPNQKSHKSRLGFSGTSFYGTTGWSDAHTEVWVMLRKQPDAR